MIFESVVFPKTVRTVCRHRLENATSGIGVFQKTGQRKGRQHLLSRYYMWEGLSMFLTFHERP